MPRESMVELKKGQECTHEHHHLIVFVVHVAPEVGNGVILPKHEVNIDGVLPPYRQQKPCDLQVSLLYLLLKERIKSSCLHVNVVPGSTPTSRGNLN